MAAHLLSGARRPPHATSSSAREVAR